MTNLLNRDFEPSATGESNSFILDRRDFLRSGAAGLVVCFTVGLSEREALAGTGSMIGAYIQIDTDGKTPQGNIVTVYIGSTDMGQGILTGLSQLVAEELMVPWAQVRAEHAPAGAAYANPLFKMQLTGGSTSMRGWWGPLRQAAAVAREQLKAAAAPVLGAPDPSYVTMSNGTAIYNGNSVAYSQVASAAASQPTPNPLPTPLTSGFQIIGKSVARTDIPDKVSGNAQFGIDVKVSGMVFAAVKHCPTIGGTVAAMPSKPSGALALVNLTNAVAVVATDTWTAMKLANGLSVNWNIPSTSAAIDSNNISTTSNALLTSASPTGLQTIVSSGTPDTALSSATFKIDATYQLPHLAHACMEPINCTASVTATSCEIWAPTQGQASCVATAKKLLNLTDSQITVHTTFLGGGLGRKIEQDFIAQAILISRAVGKPVKLTWAREQDFTNDKYRPSAFIRVQAGMMSPSSTSTASLGALVYRNVASSIAKQNGSTNNDTGAVAGATSLSYTIDNKRIEFVPNNVGVPLGYWRSVGESYNIFAVESAIDELALASGQTDTLAFRKMLLPSTNSRALAVLDAVAKLSNWYTAPSAGRARGLAFMSSFGSITASVVEISLNPTTLQIVVNNVYTAIDCGTAVNPDSVEAQMQSGAVHGLSAALWGQATFTSGKSNLSNFNTYRLMKLREMPTVAVSILNSGGPIGGIGETGVPCMAPALANAYAKLTGKRVRNLPFYPGATMGGL